MYNGEEGYIVLHIKDGRVYAHTGLKGPKTVSTFKRQREILDGIELDMAEKGLTKYYTLVSTPKQFRYALHMGFYLTGEIITGTDYAVMYKEL